MRGGTESALQGNAQDRLNALAQQRARGFEPDLAIKGLGRVSDLLPEQSFHLPRRNPDGLVYRRRIQKRKGITDVECVNSIALFSANSLARVLGDLRFSRWDTRNEFRWSQRE